MDVVHVKVPQADGDADKSAKDTGLCETGREGFDAVGYDRFSALALEPIEEVFASDEPHEEGAESDEKEGGEHGRVCGSGKVGMDVLLAMSMVAT